MHKRISGIFISLILFFSFNSNVIAKNTNLHFSIRASSFTSGARTFTGKDVAKLFEAYNAGENYSVYGIQRALFFKDDYGNMYVAAINEKANTLIISKINIDNMINLDAALKRGFDSEIIARLQNEDPAFALVFQPTANLSRSKSYAGFAEEVIERDFPALEQLYDEYGKDPVQTTVKNVDESDSRLANHQLETDNSQARRSHKNSHEIKENQNEKHEDYSNLALQRESRLRRNKPESLLEMTEIGNKLVFTARPTVKMNNYTEREVLKNFYKHHEHEIFNLCKKKFDICEFDILDSDDKKLATYGVYVPENPIFYQIGKGTNIDILKKYQNSSLIHLYNLSINDRKSISMTRDYWYSLADLYYFFAVIYGSSCQSSYKEKDKLQWIIADTTTYPYGGGTVINNIKRNEYVIEKRFAARARQYADWYPTSIFHAETIKSGLEQFISKYGCNSKEVKNVRENLFKFGEIHDKRNKDHDYE